ncbi:MAG: hypothetical protein ACREAA_13595 [Candidatus Polarisedimenticolia bacterium]
MKRVRLVPISHATRLHGELTRHGSSTSWSRCPEAGTATSPASIREFLGKRLTLPPGD